MAENTLSEVSDFLSNVKSNNTTALAMTNNTDENGLIAELTVATSAESNIYAVFQGTFNHFKIAHAKKQLDCNYVKGATAADDTFIYDVIVKYNTSTSSINKTVLCSIDLSAFISIESVARDAAVSGLLANSADLSVDWDKLSAMTDVSVYLTAHNNFNNAVRNALVSVSPFAKL